MHTFLQNGILSVEVWAFADSCSAIGKSMADVEAFFQDGWEFPQAQRHKSNRLWRVFSHWRTSEKSDKLRCTAGECLGLYVLFRHWVQIYAQSPALAKQRQSLAYGWAWAHWTLLKMHDLGG